ncbi:hypothetical protein B0T24DRAFT_703884 [Lasiosphaeria ovina]|uniref:Uncharacterized protein n=1 Tax=Lasiosphaeria ovina TaxID=92902 RepID=A0AAE0N892_9PEZI|nr:hypothetical protein B0T24DRAFT_703884 [Lasiosphaeria ovina]
MVAPWQINGLGKRYDPEETPLYLYNPREVAWVWACGEWEQIENSCARCGLHPNDEDSDSDGNNDRPPRIPFDVVNRYGVVVRRGGSRLADSTSERDGAGLYNGQWRDHAIHYNVKMRPPQEQQPQPLADPSLYRVDAMYLGQGKYGYYGAAGFYPGGTHYPPGHPSYVPPALDGREQVERGMARVFCEYLTAEPEQVASLNTEAPVAERFRGLERRRRNGPAQLREQNGWRRES